MTSQKIRGLLLLGKKLSLRPFQKNDGSKKKETKENLGCFTKTLRNVCLQKKFFVAFNI